MTPEDRANEIVWRLVACAVVHARANTSDDVWHPDGLRDAIAAAVREAVAEERARIVAIIRDGEEHAAQFVEKWGRAAFGDAMACLVRAVERGGEG